MQRVEIKYFFHGQRGFDFPLMGKVLLSTGLEWSRQICEMCFRFGKQNFNNSFIYWIRFSFASWRDNMKTFACFRVCRRGRNIRIDMEDEEGGEGRKFAGVHVN